MMSNESSNINSTNSADESAEIEGAAPEAPTTQPATQAKEKKMPKFFTSVHPVKSDPWKAEYITEFNSAEEFKAELKKLQDQGVGIPDIKAGLTYLKEGYPALREKIQAVGIEVVTGTKNGEPVSNVAWQFQCLQGTGKVRHTLQNGFKKGSKAVLQTLDLTADGKACEETFYGSKGNLQLSTPTCSAHRGRSEKSGGGKASLDGLDALEF